MGNGTGWNGIRSHLVGPKAAPPSYKPGVVALYEGLGLPCVPVALNSGLFWPRHSLMRYPGTIVVEFLEAIPPGLPRAEFRATLESRIEDATGRLMDEQRLSPYGRAIDETMIEQK